MILDYRRVKEFPDYIISNYGIIWSIKFGKVRELKQSLDIHGYNHVVLYKDGFQKTLKIHALVGNAFIGLRTGEMTFDHIDRIKTNNRADNIRLATKSEQSVNQKINKRNKFGEKNVCSWIDKRTGYEYFRIAIYRNKKTAFEKHLNKKNYTIEDAIKVRDDFLLTL